MRHDEAREVGGAGAADIRGPKVERSHERIANHLGRQDLGDAAEEGDALAVAELVGQIAGGSLGGLATGRNPVFLWSFVPAERTLTKNRLPFLRAGISSLPRDSLSSPVTRASAGVQHGGEANDNAGRVEEPARARRR